MKAFRIISRSVRDSLKSLIRNFSLSIAATLSVTVTLILVSISLISSENIKYTTKNIEDELSIVIYVSSEATEENLGEIKKELNNIEEISRITLKTKDEWKTEMSDYSDTFKTVLNYLDENPLLDSFIVKVYDVGNLSRVAEYIKSIDYVDTVKYGESMVDSIVSVFDVIKNAGTIIVLSLVLVTAFLINNTIKLTIFSRREEIEIMRLVGASNTTIKLPFIFEGFLIGLFGAIIPLSLTIYGYIILYTNYNGRLFKDMIMLVKPVTLLVPVSLVLVLLSTILGMLGSMNAVRKYLKI